MRGTSLEKYEVENVFKHSVLKTASNFREMLTVEDFKTEPQRIFVEILKEAGERNATDVELSSGDVPRMGILKDIRLSNRVSEQLSLEAMKEIITTVIPPQLKGIDVYKLLPISFSFSIQGVGHYRVNAMGSRLGITMSIRKLPFMVPTVQQIGLPAYVTQCFMELANGLFLVTGPTGSGKTTTIASLLNEINENRAVKILTIEDPIEYVHMSQKAHIVQVEVGIHVKSFHEGIYHALRANPYIIHIGEIRSTEEIEDCLNAAESGHLVVSSFHVGDTVGAIERIMYQVKDEVRRRLVVSMLKAVVNQRLFVKEEKDETGQTRHIFHVACELLLVHNNYGLKSKIYKGEFESIRQELASGLYRDKRSVSFSDAIRGMIEAGKLEMKDVASHGYYDLYYRLTE